MPRKPASVPNTLVQATIFKKCDRTNHKPDTNKGCAAGTCQHTCEAGQVRDCAHKWTVRYSVNSRQREQSFGTLTEAQTFQLTLSTGKQTQGAMFTDPRAGMVDFLPLCDAYVEGMAKANAKSKATYRSNFANPAVAQLLEGKSVLDVARMDAEVKTLLNKTLGSYSDDYRGNIRRIITGTLDECVRGIIPRHTLTGIELAPRIVTAEQYEQQNTGMVPVADDTVRMLAEGITAPARTSNGRRAPASCPAWASPPGCSARWDCGSGRPWESASPTSGSAQTAPATCTCAGRPARTAGSWSRSSTARPETSGTSRARHDLGHGPAAARRPAVPRPDGTPYMPYSTAANRFGRMLDHLGISGVHTHSLRHQFASEALDANPRELANISQVLGHDSIETTLRFYIHPSANAEQRIGAMMNARWTAKPSRSRPR